MVSLNKALLNPYFWGGTLGGVGWLAMNIFFNWICSTTLVAGFLNHSRPNLWFLKLVQGGPKKTGYKWGEMGPQ